MKLRHGALFCLFSLPVLLFAADPPGADATRLASGMDTSVKPYADFYQYANGKWLADAVIPADRASFAMFDVVEDRNRDVLHEILEDAAKEDKAPKDRIKDSIKAKVGAFYASGMDEKRIAEAGAKPLQEELDRIAALKDGAGVLKAIAHLQAVGVGPAFAFSAEQDPKDSKRMIAGLGQGGLGLPDRDYYLKDDDETKKTRNAYRAHIEKMLTLLGDDPKQAAAEAGMILELETRLAKASKSNVDLRDPLENYHLMTLDKLESETPGLDWKTYLDDLGLAGVKEADLGQPDFFKEVGRMIASTPVDAWKAYLRWNVVSHYASYLSPPFVEENFHFFGTVLNGVPEMQPRWKRVLEATDGLLGEALGQLYVAKAFPPEAKARAEAMVKNIRAALRNDLAHLDWMSPETRQEAVKKVDALTVKIGYPSKWRDYSGLTLDRDAAYVVNVMRGEAFLRKQELDKIGKPTDFAEWEMSPPTVNAYYEPTKNEIVFPAGILQPPFFDAQADDAVNYGAIGAVIGHEMTHGFDDQGRQYDAEGNLRDWWTPADAKAFQERAAKIVAQYDTYTVLDGLHVNGKLTLGENIADLGGVKLSYLAFKKSLEGKPAAAKIDGYTAEQRYFLAFAQMWRDKMRPEAERVHIATNPHSPPRYRVLGVLYNTPEFFEAFDATQEQADGRENPKPVRIW